MQLRKPATAILALALSAGLAQADDAAPAAGSTLDKIAKNGVIVVGHRETQQTRLTGEIDSDHLTKPYSTAAKRHFRF